MEEAVMANKFRNKLAVPQAEKTVAGCKVEFAKEFEVDDVAGSPNRLATTAQKKAKASKLGN